MEMEEIELTRAADDGRTYHLGAIGSLRLNGWLMRSATACAGSDTFLLKRTWSAVAEAKDADGRTVGTFQPRSIRRGGTLTWRGTGYTIRPAAPLRERYELIEGERQLGTIEARGWWGWGTRRPLIMTVPRHESLDPGLLLFVAYVVRTLADKSGEDAGGASVVTSTGSYSG